MRRLVKTWFMRNTVHIVPADKLPFMRSALRESLLSEWNRWTIKTGKKENEHSWESIYPRIKEVIQEPSSASEIMDRLTCEEKMDQLLLTRIIREMSHRGIICHGPSKGPWYHNTENTYTSLEEWLPDYREPDSKKIREKRVIWVLPVAFPEAQTASQPKGSLGRGR